MHFAVSLQSAQMAMGGGTVNPADTGMFHTNRQNG
jgi:hypothetical protein